MFDALGRETLRVLVTFTASVLILMLVVVALADRLLS